MRLIGNGLAAPLSGTPLFGHYTNDYAEVFNEISRLDQNANPPIFIPSLVELRRKCFDHVSSSLLQLEREMQSMHQDKDKVNRAIGLLRDMG
ncbi:hypothetical protein SLS56_003156 [Neofusicoccum ribis]|uniref:Uncharacterized protein n=1 Tax=Neofusicoccum ribis TaxID=45134 RepID=A0ABR3T0H1_9PEZI